MFSRQTDVIRNGSVNYSGNNLCENGCENVNTVVLLIHPHAHLDCMYISTFSQCAQVVDTDICFLIIEEWMIK